MNFNDFQEVYQEMINTFKRDPSITNILIDFKIQDITNQKKTAIINCDIRSKKNVIKFKTDEK